MSSTPNHLVRLKDYAPYPFALPTLELSFELNPTATLVRAKSSFVATSHPVPPLVLKGERLELISVLLDDRELKPTEYELDATSLTIHPVNPEFTLTITTQCNPSDNKAFSGLYISNEKFFTQCEAEGFRRITYHPDRPDVLSRYTTTLTAEKRHYPVLLSNGNRVGSGGAGLTHWACFEDPYPKPSYLFALVAGDLQSLTDHYLTRSNRLVGLHIYSERSSIDGCQYALEALKKSMQWDEVHFDREYDLDHYVIVAVSDFNMGAMENKGLNIFNTQYIYARPDTATDSDYSNIDRVVGHEYFHNWSGNRITCRDWFQLSLKEGFTVFREQQFVQSLNNNASPLVDNAKMMMNRQFAEDASPLSHPVRPQEYIEINNFYTVTIYEKGAEVIRMLQTLLGQDSFKSACIDYFERFDGTAATVENFISSMEKISGRCLKQFMHWYDQAGTPYVSVSERYHEKTKTLELTLTQSHAQAGKAWHPLLIPIKIALFDAKGHPLEVQSDLSTHERETEFTLELSQSEQTYNFQKVAAKPTLSILREFSAPVIVWHQLSLMELCNLVKYESDLFSRWNALQRSQNDCLQHLSQSRDTTPSLPAELASLYEHLLRLDDELLIQSVSLALPSEKEVFNRLSPLNLSEASQARRQFAKALGLQLYSRLEATYRRMLDVSSAYTPDNAVKRSLKNHCLMLMAHTEKPEAYQLCLEQVQTATNMTDVISALKALSTHDTPSYSAGLDYFFKQWSHRPLLVNKWLSIQAQAPHDEVVEKLQALMKLDVFDISNPNKVYALLNTFASENLNAFHTLKGYHFIKTQILILDKFNPQVASRLAQNFSLCHKLDKKTQQWARKVLQEIHGVVGLSRDVREIVEKCFN